jgi:hypothetical protein
MDELIKSLSETAGWVLHYLINHDDAELLGLKESYPVASFQLNNLDDIAVGIVKIQWRDPNKIKSLITWQHAFTEIELVKEKMPVRKIAYFLVAEIVTSSKCKLNYKS